MKRDRAETKNGIPVATPAEAQKLAELAAARAHKAKLRLKHSRKVYKELKKAAKKARKLAKSLKQRSVKADRKRKAKTASKAKARPATKASATAPATDGRAENQGTHSI